MTYNTQFESTIHDSMGSHSPTGINVRSRSYLKMDVPRSDVSGKGGGGLNIVPTLKEHSGYDPTFP